MVSFLKPSVLFQRLKGLEKEWIESVLESSTVFIVQPLLEAAGFC